MKAAGRLGGKASSWLLLSEAGIPSPAGFAIGADEVLDVANIEQRLGVLQASTGCVAVAVRSSGVGEDGSHHALAGLFESSLDVPARGPEVLEAVARCRSLGASARALSAMGHPVPMGVLVQEMVHPLLSGVLFTRDPLGQQVGMVVEAVHGHLSRLVDGRQNATRWRLGVEATPQAFCDLDQDRLRRIGLDVETLIGGPADIEWALTTAGIVVLQARPITSLSNTLEPGLTLIPVCAANAHKLPPDVAQHDKIALRLVASELDIGIANGLVALASSPTSTDIAEAASAISGWGDFIAVLLSPFDLDGDIFRRFGNGGSASAALSQFVGTISARHSHFAFLLKELQDTASTGIAVRLADGSIRIELVHGHFITKGFADPTVYVLDADGCLQSRTLGNQRLAMQVVQGKTVRVPVEDPVEATGWQLAEVHRAVVGLANRYPGAGVEFGLTPEGDLFLIDLYQSHATTPPDRSDVLSHGRVIGRIRVLDLPDDAIEQSVERHVHSRRTARTTEPGDAEILVVKRPLHLLDRLIYEAAPGSLGFICEGGALLCHLAVVMREHGVPGWIEPGATGKFTDGERIILDTRPGSRSVITRA